MIYYANCKHGKPSDECFSCPNVEAVGPSTFRNTGISASSLPPGTYEAKMISVEIRNGVLHTAIALPNGQVTTLFSGPIEPAPEPEPDLTAEMAEVFARREHASSTLRFIANWTGTIAELMREHERDFDEDDFDELGRIAGAIFLIAERAKP